MLNHILRAGDRVRMRMSSDSRGFGVKGVEDGTLGTVTGRYRAHGIIVARYPKSSFREPGVYSIDGTIMVKWDEYPNPLDAISDDFNRVPAVWLEPADSFRKEYKERYATEWPVRLANGEYDPDFNILKEGDKLDNIERTGDLPETPFWELDIVFYQGKRYRIHHIDYNQWGPERRHCYSMEEVDENNVYMRSGMTTVEPDDLTLVERGNVWKEAHGEPLSFHSLEEQTSFEINMGRSDEVRNPLTNLYHWTKEDVLQALRDGIVDGFHVGDTFDKRITARKYHNKEFGDKLRHATLVGFDLIPAEAE